MKMGIILVAAIVLLGSTSTDVAARPPKDTPVELPSSRSHLTTNLTFDAAQQLFGGIHHAPVILKGAPDLLCVWNLTGGNKLYLRFNRSNSRLCEAIVKTSQGNVVETIMGDGREQQVKQQ